MLLNGFLPCLPSILPFVSLFLFTPFNRIFRVLFHSEQTRI
jgi:hypothetical protein